MGVVMLIILSIGAGVLYRCGGVGRPYNTKIRDLGVPSVLSLALLILGGYPGNWLAIVAFIAAFGLLFAALVTYWDFLFKKDTFWFSGLVVGLAGLPLSLVCGKFIGVIIRMLIIAGVWECLNRFLPEKILCWRRDVAEEFGRGFITLITVPLLYI